MQHIPSGFVSKRFSGSIAAEFVNALEKHHEELEEIGGVLESYTKMLNQEVNMKLTLVRRF
jgi:hypothetical protein